MDCQICQQQITNPLSPECLGEAISQWLVEAAPDKIDSFELLTRSYASSRGEKCIVTGRRFCVCTHCYTKDVFNWLDDGHLQLEYLQFFDFISA